MNRKSLMCVRDAVSVGRCFRVARFYVCIGLSVLAWPASAQESETLLESKLQDGTAAEQQTAAPELDTSQIRALLVPRRQAKISSMVTARIRRLHYRIGDRFERGATMVTFDCEVLQAGYDSSHAALEQHQLTYASNKELRRDGAVSQLDLALSKAKLEQGKAELELAHEQLRKCTIKAPFSGRVAARFVNEFEMVSLGDPLLSVLDDSTLEMNLHLPSIWITRVSVEDGFSVRVDETDRVYEAVVQRISPQIDPTSRTFLVIGALPGQNPELRAGMSGTATFPSLQ